MNILTNNNNINADELCIGDECIDFSDDKNKILPRPPGKDGVCTDNDCYECTCENGEEAATSEFGLSTCKKKRSDRDREQCISCNIGYGLVDGRCEECTGDFYSDEVTVNTCKSCSDLKCKTTNYQNGNPYLKRINCGGTKTGICRRKQCICGMAAASCTSETENTCLSCNAGYKLSAPSASSGANCVECEALTYKSNTSTATSCNNCKTCNTTINNCDAICYEKQNESNFCRLFTAGQGGGGVNYDCSGCIGNCGEWQKINRQFRQKCGGTSGGSCVNCQTCGTGKYRKDCGNADLPHYMGTCENCESCPRGQTRLACKDTDPGICQQNYCTCSNGDEATGSACTTDGANICISCEDTHYLNGNNCVARPTCSTKKYDNVSCSTIMSNWNRAALALNTGGDISRVYEYVMSVMGYSQSQLNAIITDCSQLCK